VLDFPASGAALWALFDAGGPRPEYVLPVLYSESGFDPSVPNHAGYPYYGINQASTSLITAYAGTDPTTYMTWAASEQISTVVSGMFKAIVTSYGPLRSGTRCYQANFLPATLATAHGLGSVLATSPSAIYTANAGFDTAHKGTITVQDLANFVARAATTAAVQQAIAATYALRPALGRPHDPVYGEDFPRGVPIVGLAIAGGLIYAALHLKGIWRS
jgi:hypothetical protein